MIMESKANIKSLLKLLLLTLCACVFSQDAKSTQRTINICAGLHPYDMNPHTAFFTAEAQLFTGLYEGLFSYDPATLEPVAALCKQHKVSRDKKRWTFVLRDDAKFSDGSPITSSHVKSSWLTLLATPDAPFASLFDCVEGARDYRLGKADASSVRIDIRDDHTLVVHLEEPAGHFSKILCHHAFSVVGENPSVYSGAFVLESYDESGISLVKNSHYWDAKSVKAPAIRITLSDDYGENSFRFNNGEFDWIQGNADLAKIIDKSKLQVGAEFGTMYLFFKERGSVWSKKEFRQALLEAIPYDKLRENYNVKAETLIYQLPGYPSVSGFSDYDPDDAKTLMHDARKKYGVADDEKLALVFATTTEESTKKWGEILKAAWEPLGVDFQVQTTPTDRYNASIPSWKADLFHYSWIADFSDPLAFLELFRGDSSLNVANFKNESFDELVKDGSSCEELYERYKTMARAEQLLLDECVIIPISHPISAHLIDLNTIGGWKVNSLDLHPLKYLYVKSESAPDVPNLVCR